LVFFAILVVFASCQNETLDQGAASIVEQELAMEDQILVSDGEEDETFILNQDLTTEMPARELTFTLSSNLSNGSSDCTPDLEALELSLPDTLRATTTAKPGVDSYFTLDILDSSLAGTDIAAWCVDQDLSLRAGETLDFAVYSSYETLPEGEFEFPENFDKVNWVLNQNFIGEASVAGGNYTFGHIQYAIWLLVDDSVCRECSALFTPGNETWVSNSEVNVAMAQEIVDAAVANGQDFVPGCGEKVGVYYTKIETNCNTKIGPGYFRGVFNVISGESSHGGELCEYVYTYNCIRYWWQ